MLLKTHQGFLRVLLPLLLLLAVSGSILVCFPATTMWLGTPVQWILLFAFASMT